MNKYLKEEDKKIVLNWNNDGHGTRTDKERKGAQEYYEEHKDKGIEYYY